jgi:hypothetical protein
MTLSLRALLLLTLMSPLSSFSQDTTNILSSYSDSIEYRIIMKTQEKINDQYIALDVFTIKAYLDSTKVYYVRYGDMLISSLTMQYSIIDRIIEFEQKVNSLACIEEDHCTNRILIEGTSNAYTVPIDVLHEELLSNLMLELEK